MSKISMDRPRHIAVLITAANPISRRAFQNALRGRARHEGWADADTPQVTRFEWPHAAVRVDHLHAAAARQLLANVTWVVEGDVKIPVKVKTLSTSGTLAALTSRVGVLSERAPEPGRTPADRGAAANRGGLGR